jgi:hypothetical protein
MSPNFVPVNQRSTPAQQQQNQSQKQQKKHNRKLSQKLILWILLSLRSDDDGEAFMAGHYCEFLSLPQDHALFPSGLASSHHPDIDAPEAQVFMAQGPVCIGIAANADCLDKDKSSEFVAWYTDGGASHHFTPVRSFLHDYVPDDPLHPVMVRVATDQLVPRAGVGSLRVKTNIEGRHFAREISGVWHVPSFGRSLLSVNR